MTHIISDCRTTGNESSPVPPTAADTVTTARCLSRPDEEPHVAAKTITPRALETQGDEGIEDFNAGWQFRLQTHPVNGLSDLFDFLGVLVDLPDAYVVYGRPLRSVGRRTHLPKWGPQQSLIAKLTRQLWMDFDTAPPQSWLDNTDALAVGRYLRSLLAPEFRRAPCICQLTAGAGIKPTPRARLVFWSRAALSLPEIKLWMRRQPVRLDLSIYKPSQPIYTATPIFQGVKDPVSGPRVVLVPKESV